MHSADLSILTPWGVSPMGGEGGSAYSAFHSLYGGIYLISPFWYV